MTAFIQCGRCPTEALVEDDSLMPDDWSRRDGLNLCPLCVYEADSAYLAGHGWTRVASALDDLPDSGVWADPLGEVRHQRLGQAVQVQQRRDAYGQLEIELGGAA